MDEFQAIMDYPEQNVEALLRTYIQDCQKRAYNPQADSLSGNTISHQPAPFKEVCLPCKRKIL